LLFLYRPAIWNVRLTKIDYNYHKKQSLVCPMIFKAIPKLEYSNIKITKAQRNKICFTIQKKSYLVVHRLWHSKLGYGDLFSTAIQAA